MFKLQNLCFMYLCLYPKRFYFIDNSMFSFNVQCFSSVIFSVVPLINEDNAWIFIERLKHHFVSVKDRIFMRPLGWEKLKKFLPYSLWIFNFRFNSQVSHLNDQSHMLNNFKYHKCWFMFFFCLKGLQLYKLASLWTL